MPRKEEISFWDSPGFWLGLVIILIVPILLVYNPHGERILPTMAIGKVLFFIFMVLWFVLGSLFIIFRLSFDEGDKGKCYYCQKEIITNFHKRIFIEWPETTKYSGKEILVHKEMHFSCHRDAKEKFKIPDPKFASISI